MEEVSALTLGPGALRLHTANGHHRISYKAGHVNISDDGQVAIIDYDTDRHFSRPREGSVPMLVNGTSREEHELMHAELRVAYSVFRSVSLVTVPTLRPPKVIRPLGDLVVASYRVGADNPLAVHYRAAQRIREEGNYCQQLINQAELMANVELLVRAAYRSLANPRASTDIF